MPAPQLEPEPPKPTPAPPAHRIPPQEDGELGLNAQAVALANVPSVKSLGDGGSPPPPPSDNLQSKFVVLLKAIGAAGTQAATIRYRVIRLLGLLIAIAVASLVAGMLAKSDVFWAASALAFGAAFCGLVAYAAKGLGVFAETAQLLSRPSDEGPPKLRLSPIPRRDQF